MNIWRHVLLFEWQEIQYFIYQNLLDTENIMCEKNINLSISAFLWKKMTVRKREKKNSLRMPAQNMCISILNMHTNVCNIRKLSNPFNWFYNTLVKFVL